jgi:hypothetical protein
MDEMTMPVRHSREKGHSMKWLLTIIALVVVTSMTSQTSVATQANDCADIAAYIHNIDSRMVEEMHALVTAPGWAAEAQAAAVARNASDEAFTEENIEPLLAYLAVPVTALRDFDPAQVPDGARQLHESATDYWLAIEDTYDAMLDDDLPGVVRVTRKIESAMERNLVAHKEIIATCPEILEPYEEVPEQHTNLVAVMGGEGDPELLAHASVEELAGIGIGFVFVHDPASVSAETDGTPTPAEQVSSTPED